MVIFYIQKPFPTYSDGGQILGKSRVQLVSKDNGYLSRANFTGISFAPGILSHFHICYCGYIKAGTYTLEIHSSSDLDVSITLGEPVVVGK